MLRVATRRSPLALWQARHVSDLLRAVHPDLDVHLVDIDTTADRRLDLPISELGGKGVFSKQVQRLVLGDEADIAVHSAKDLQSETPAGLVIGAYPARGEVRDTLVGCRLDDLPVGATVASGSQRRRIQLAETRPDLRFMELRGNIATRLAQQDQADALVVAQAALDRLGISPQVTDPLEVAVMLPQVGQGALAVECRADDQPTRRLLAAIDDAATRATVEVEREFLAELGGDCDLPAGAFAELLPGGNLRVQGVLAGAPIPVGERAEALPPIARAAVTAAAEDQPGRSVARRLRARLG